MTFNSQDGMGVLHWLSEQDRWEPIDWDDFRAWRGWNGVDWDEPPRATLHGVTGGTHHFVVCVYDFVRGEDRLVNLLPHKYLANADSTVGYFDFLAVLTQDEREDYQP